MTNVENPIFASTSYRAENFQSGVEWATKELAGLLKDAEGPDSPESKMARAAVPQYREALAFAASKSSIDMFVEYQAVVDRVKQLEAEGADRGLIGTTIINEYGDMPLHYRVILRNKSGGHKTLGQLMLAASLQSNS